MIRSLAAAMLLVFGLTPAAAQEVTVTSDSFVVTEASSEAVFTGNVVVNRTGLKVWADKVVVAYAAGGIENIGTTTDFLVHAGHLGEGPRRGEGARERINA